MTNFEKYLTELTQERFVDSMILHCDACPAYPCRQPAELPDEGLECEKELTKWCGDEVDDG